MMKPLSLLLLLTASLSLPEEFRQYRMVQKANHHYLSGEYHEAERLYSNLLANDPDEKLKTAIRFNFAGTLALQRKYADARRLYQSIPASAEGEKTGNLIGYNEGTCFAREALATHEPGRKSELLKQALRRYTAVLSGDPADTDARINYEIVYRMLQKQNASSSSKSGGRGENGDPAPAGSQSMKPAERILENAQLQENEVMRKIPQIHDSGTASAKNVKDW
ncbi:MAG: hypothetical protein HGA81_03210 [Chlorobium limicola]|jgi:tetratricopeptide (TPR) repeat protein|nr:hypothetical protein [Chlorobium limicola]